MTEDVETTDVKPPKRRNRARSALIGFLVSVGLAVGVLGLLIGRPLSLPEPLRARIETAVNAGAVGQGVSIGGIDMVVGKDWATRAILRNVTIRDDGGAPLAAFARVRARLSPGAMMDRRIAPTSVVVDGVEVVLRRQIDGSLSVVGQGTGTANTGDALAALAQAMASPPFDQLQSVAVDDLTLTLEDARTGRIWQATGGDAVLRRRGEGLSLSLGADVFNGTEDLARVEFTFDYSGGGGGGALGVRLTDMAARDIALQAPALSWLSALDAPISGAVRVGISPTGGLERLDGTLDFGEGALSPTEGAKPLKFEAGRAYLTFDRARDRVEFSEIEVRTEDIDVAASGHVYLDEMKDGWPGAFLGQIDFSRVRVNDASLPSEINLKSARADVRLRLDPFRIELGEATLADGTTRAVARGRVTADRDGWHLTLDARTRKVATAKVMSYWPERVATGTRTWLTDNVGQGDLTDVAFSLRAESGSKPKIDMSFGFKGAEVQVLNSLPTVSGDGFGSLQDGRLSIEVTEGAMETPEGTVDAAGSVFTIFDTREKPRRAEAQVRAAGPIGAALWAVNQPPFRVMERAGRGIDIAKGDANVDASIRFPLKKGITGEEVDYSVAAVATDVTSQEIVPGRSLAARSLDLRASPRLLEIAGSAALDGVAIDGAWTQPLGAAAAEGSRVEGEVALNDAAARTFGLALPEGSISGEGTARIELALKKGEAPRLALASDLDGIGLSLPQIGWRKAASREGELTLQMSLGETPKIDRLALSAPGLEAEGQVLFRDGKFAQLGLSRLRVGGWLNAAVDLTPGPGGAPRVAIRGGRFDLRAFESLGGGGGGRGQPIEVALDEMIVSDGIRIAPMRGQMTPMRGGVDGQFSGLVGGRTPVSVRLSPAPGGTALRVRADDAGGTLRDAGLIKTAQGGSLDLVMVPVRDASGFYDGDFRITGVRMRDAPAMVDLLDGISVVGLLDQLEGPGILFDNVDGRFRLGPDRLRLIQASATGGSLGVSADGLIDLVNKRMDIRGVISPVYFLNGIGSILTRRGEGLFGFNYRMTGSVSSPDVGVNPLSILTPGMFREIFRSPAPTQ